MKTETFSIDRERLERIRAALHNKGLELVGDSGSIKKLGADVDYVYADGHLILTFKHAPIWHNFDRFVDEVSDFVNNTI